MKKLLFYIRVIGIIILIYILCTLKYEKLFEVLKSIDLNYIILYVLSYCVFLYFKILRFKYILNHHEERPPFLDIFGATIESQYLGFVTPSRIGDSVKILFLHEKSGVSKKIGTIAYIYDRFQDVYFVLLLGIIAFVFILKLSLNLYFIFFAIAIAFLFVYRNKLLLKISKKLKIDKFKETNFKMDFFLFLINIIIYTVYFLQYYCLALSLNIHIGFFYLSAVSIVGALAAMIPISISGIGVREGVFIYYLTKIGVYKESAFLLSFLDNTGFTILFIVVFHIAYKLLALKFDKKQNI